MHLLSSVVLDNAGITRVVHCKELSELCPNVLELHLAANKITSWNSVRKLAVEYLLRPYGNLHSMNTRFSAFCKFQEFIVPQL